MSIKTFKVKHNQDYKEMFEKAYQIALFAQESRGSKLPTTKAVKHLGLKSDMANQILRKYHNAKKLKVIKKDNVKLIIPGRATRLNRETKEICIILLKKLTLPCWFDLTEITKVNQVELGPEYAFISCTIPDKPQIQSEKFIGIDLNSSSHAVVIANQQTDKVKKYGKKIPHTQKKYKEIRRRLQQAKAFKLLKKIKNRESRIVNEELHQITTAIVKEAVKTQCHIKVENLKGISKKNTKKNHKQSNFSLNSWPFFKFKQLLTYKAMLSGISVFEINPSGTSQDCSKCGIKGNRDKKLFRCEQQGCEHVDHADVNAAFNIALRPVQSTGAKSAQAKPGSRPKINSGKNEIIRRGTLISPNGNDLESKSTVEQFFGFAEEPHVL